MTADPRAVEIRSDSANAEIRTLWQLVYDTVRRRASGAPYASIRAVIVDEIFDALTAAGWSLLPPGGRDLYVVIKSVPGRAPEIMADIVSDLDELRQWLADLRNDPDRDPLATYAGYRLAPSDTPGEPA